MSIRSPTDTLVCLHASHAYKPTVKCSNGISYKCLVVPVLAVGVKGKDIESPSINKVSQMPLTHD